MVMEASRGSKNTKCCFRGEQVWTLFAISLNQQKGQKDIAMMTTKSGILQPKQQSTMRSMKRDGPRTEIFQNQANGHWFGSTVVADLVAPDK